MRVLITGANGFIGRSLLSQLKQNDIEVITIGRGAIKENAQHFSIDIFEADGILRVIKKIQPARLIHLAWYTEHGKYWNSSLNLNWVSATWHLLDAFYAAGGEHALVAGTCAEYDWRQGYCIENLTPANPTSVYGIAKDTSRRISETLANKYGATLAWARIFYPYGVGESATRLVPSLFAAFKGEIAPFSVCAAAYRDLLHVSDVANALFICSQAGMSGIVNISSGKPTQISEVVETIARLCKSDSDIILGEKGCKKSEPTLLVGENKKLRSLGWKQSIELEHGLQEYLMEFQ